MEQMALSPEHQSALEDTTAHYLYHFYLAHVGDINCTAPIARTPLTFTAAQGFETFEQLQLQASKKAQQQRQPAPKPAPKPASGKTRKPSTRLRKVMTQSQESKTILTSFFAALLNVVRHTLPLPQESVLTHLVNANSTVAGQAVVRFIVSVVEGMRPFLDDTNTRLGAHDLGGIRTFADKLRCLVTNTKDLNGGEEVVAKLYVEFLKCFAFYTAEYAMEGNKMTINPKVVRGIIRVMRVHDPTDSHIAVLQHISAVHQAFANTIAEKKQREAELAAAKAAALNRTEEAANGAAPTNVASDGASNGAVPDVAADMDVATDAAVPDVAADMEAALQELHT